MINGEYTMIVSDYPTFLGGPLAHACAVCTRPFLLLLLKGLGTRLISAKPSEHYNNKPSTNTEGWSRDGSAKKYTNRIIGIISSTRHPYGCFSWSLYAYVDIDLLVLSFESSRCGRNSCCPLVRGGRTDTQLWLLHYCPGSCSHAGTSPIAASHTPL